MIIGFSEMNAQKTTENSYKKLIGNWTAFVSKTTIEKNGTSKTEEILCNVCPKIIFTFERSIQNATVVMPNGKKENYIWSIKEDLISFGNIDAVYIRNPFFDSEYKFKLSKKKGYRELELLNPKTKNIIILRQ